MGLVPRGQWGARPPRSVAPLRNPRSLTVHWNGPALDLADHARCARVVKAIQNFHLDRRRWADIAYSFLVCPHGYVFAGRGWGARTAANGTKAGNDDGHAVMAMIGEGQTPTSAMLTALLELHREDRRRHGDTALVPHSHWKPTDCPGDPLRAWIARPTPKPSEEDPVYVKFDGDRPASVYLLAGEVLVALSGDEFRDQALAGGDRSKVLRIRNDVEGKKSAFRKLRRVRRG